MKITKRQLRRIIRESITHSLLETSPTKFKVKNPGAFGRKMKKAFNMSDEDLNQFLDKVEDRMVDGGEKAVDAAKYVFNKEYMNLVGMDSRPQAYKRAKKILGNLFK